MDIARQVIHAACAQPCPAILQSAWEPPALFAMHQLSWRKCGKKEILDSKPSGQPAPILLGPLQFERASASEKKWTIAATLLPPDYEGKLAKMNTAFRAWLQPHWDTERLFMSRWKTDYRKEPRPPVRFWKARGGKFERTDAPTGGIIMPVVERFTRSERIYVELGMDVIVV